MSKHTPEPWEFESEPQYCSEIIGSDGNSICVFVDDPSGVDVDRILSCVNACEGMNNPAEDIATLKRQRDDVCDALERLLKASTMSISHGEYVAVFDEANAVLTKITHGAMS